MGHKEHILETIQSPAHTPLPSRSVPSLPGPGIGISLFELPSIRALVTPHSCHWLLPTWPGFCFRPGLGLSIASRKREGRLEKLKPEGNSNSKGSWKQLVQYCVVKPEAIKTSPGASPHAF